jgi:hypothetical protein
MLREMYFVYSDKFPLADGKTERSEISPLKKKQHPPYDKWASRFRENIPIAETTTLSNGKQEKKRKNRKLPLKKKARFRESNIKREALIKAFAEFLRKVLPKDTSHQQQEQLFPKIDNLSKQTLSG